MSKKKQEDSALESQIGELGKLDNRVVNPNALTSEEQASLEAFLGDSKKSLKKQSSVDTQVPIKDGWIPVDREEMGERSQFYPEDWKFYIKAASVTAIKNWSAVDEDSLTAINQVLTEILKSGVKITDGNGTTVGWSKVNSWDRFWFILKVREVTFVQGESKVEFNDNCPSCDEEITFELQPQYLHFEMPDPQVIEDYWNPQEQAWIIDPEEFNIPLDKLPVEFSKEGIIDLYCPTVGMDNLIIEYAQAKAQAKQKIDETFIRFLNWMLPYKRTPKDLKGFMKHVDTIYERYKKWDTEFFEFMVGVIKNISVNPQETLKQTCPCCGEEAVSTVHFPNGISTLFRVETSIKKFGSK